MQEKGSKNKNFLLFDRVYLHAYDTTYMNALLKILSL